MAKFNNIKNFHPNKDSTIKLMQVHKSETHLKEMTDNEVNGFFELKAFRTICCLQFSDL